MLITCGCINIYWKLIRSVSCSRYYRTVLLIWHSVISRFWRLDIWPWWVVLYETADMDRYWPGWSAVQLRCLVINKDGRGIESVAFFLGPQTSDRPMFRFWARRVLLRDHWVLGWIGCIGTTEYMNAAIGWIDHVFPAPPVQFWDALTPVRGHGEGELQYILRRTAELGGKYTFVMI